jgi:hypothetical protein
MARITIEDLKAEIDERNQEIAQLHTLVAELRERSAATAVALRLMRALIDDATAPTR